MKIALLGYGKMGKIVEKLAIKKGHTIVSRINQYSSKEEILKPLRPYFFSLREIKGNVSLDLKNSPKNFSPDFSFKNRQSI